MRKVATIAASVALGVLGAALMSGAAQASPAAPAGGCFNTVGTAILDIPNPSAGKVIWWAEAGDSFSTPLDYWGEYYKVVDHGRPGHDINVTGWVPGGDLTCIF